MTRTRAGKYTQDSTPPPEAAAASVRRQLSRHHHSPTAPAPTTDFISKADFEAALTAVTADWQAKFEALQESHIQETDALKMWVQNMDHIFSTLEVAQAHAKARVDGLAQVLREHATGQEAAHQGLTVAAAATREHHDVQAVHMAHLREGLAAAQAQWQAGHSKIAGHVSEISARVAMIATAVEGLPTHSIAPFPSMSASLVTTGGNSGSMGSWALPPLLSTRAAMAEVEAWMAQEPSLALPLAPWQQQRAAPAAMSAPVVGLYLSGQEVQDRPRGHPVHRPAPPLPRQEQRPATGTPQVPLRQLPARNVGLPGRYTGFHIMRSTAERPSSARDRPAMRQDPGQLLRSSSLPATANTDPVPAAAVEDVQKEAVAPAPSGYVLRQRPNSAQPPAQSVLGETAAGAVKKPPLKGVEAVMDLVDEEAEVGRREAGVSVAASVQGSPSKHGRSGGGRKR